MKDSSRVTTMMTVGFGLVFLVGCPGVMPDGSPDLTTPAPCSNDADCPEGIACVLPNGEDQGGFCDVDDTQVTTGTPAPCSSDADCPEGVACLFADGGQDGFCDVDEMLAP